LSLIFSNGFHDAANSVATVVTTRVLSPLQAVLWAAFFNFIAAFLFGTGVAQTISNKLIDPKAVDVYVVCGGLIGAIVWDIITWLMALPTSSSHAIISGYAGAAIAKAGWSSIPNQGLDPRDRVLGHLSFDRYDSWLGNHDRLELAHSTLESRQDRKTFSTPSVNFGRSIFARPRNE
jgi:hypothetical protein